jgi:hypothetical protein
MTKSEDSSPAGRCIGRKVLKDKPRMSTRKPRCGPRNRGIKLINEREPARKPAFAILERKPKQKELLTM